MPAARFNPSLRSGDKNWGRDCLPPPRIYEGMWPFPVVVVVIVLNINLRQASFDYRGSRSLDPFPKNLVIEFFRNAVFSREVEVAEVEIDWVAILWVENGRCDGAGGAELNYEAPLKTRNLLISLPSENPQYAAF